MSSAALLDTLCKLLPSQLDLLIAKLDAPAHILPGPTAPLATRAIDLLRWADQQHRRADLEHLCAQMIAPAPVEPNPSRPPRWAAKLNGSELKELSDALLSAFPTRSALAQMLRFGLDKNLDALTAERSNLGTTVFELLTTAEAEGWIPRLFEAALAHVPGSPALLAIAEKRRA